MLSERTFGVEIEHGNKKMDYSGVESKLEERYPAWANDVSMDGSGIEVASPVLKGKDGLAEFKEVLAYLHSLGGFMGVKDGFHVHHGGEGFLENEKAIHRLLKSWGNNQAVISAMCPSRRNNEGSIDGITFCRLVTPEKAKDIVKDISARKGDMEFKVSGGTRFYALNVTALAKHGTIELRQHHGTWDFTRLSAWIEFGQKFIEGALKHEVRNCNTPLALLREMGMGSVAIRSLRKVVEECES